MALKLGTLILTLGTFGSVHALNAPQNSTIEWRTCEQNGTSPVTCGTLNVPLDYSDPSSEKLLELSLVKVSATKHPRKGSILFNPGGPGVDGTDFINGPVAEDLLLATGGYHDLIGWDPRGTGNTLPVSCYSNDINRQLALLKRPATINVSDIATGQMWAVTGTLAENCRNNARETGELISTAFVARDMMQIVDALQEDGLLRYWGFSYGTALGATVAAMFPDRMDKVVLDGVLNPHQYYSGRDVEEWADSDATWAGFFSGCVDAPAGNCALARSGATAADLEQQVIELLFETLKYNPIAAGPAELTSVVDNSLLKGAIVLALYSPSLWPGLARALDGLIQGNATALLEYVALLEAPGSSTLIEINAGIRCGDNSIQAEKLDELLPLIQTLYNESYIFGDILGGVIFTCAQWRIQPKERYEGGFDNIQTRNPLLFIGNTYDPLTPLVSARNASAAFVDSVVLQHNGYGHCSTAQPSLCTAKVVQNYFVNGTLPEEGLICEPDSPLFSNTTTQESPSGDETLSKRNTDISGDEALLEAMKRLGKEVSRHARLRF